MTSQKIDGIETRESGEPELALDEGLCAVGVVVGEDVAGDKEEGADKDVAVVDDWVEKAEVRRREVEEDDGQGEQGTDTGKRRQGRLAGGRWLSGQNWRPLGLGFGP